MNLAFCFPLTTPSALTSVRIYAPSSPLRYAPMCAKEKPPIPPPEPRQTPRSRRAKRPRSSKQTSGFSFTNTPSASTSSSPPSTEKTTSPSSPDLQKRDASGISMEHRLREEILHPLRKPKLTLFITLAFSATLGMFFAMARASQDGLQQVSKNIAVDIVAISLFGYLAWREAQFGRRSLNSLAGCPQARDLKIVSLDNGSRKGALPFGGGAKVKRLDALLGRDVVLVAGRAADVRKYLDRGGGGVRVVVVATDSRNEEEGFEGATAVASGEAEHSKDWAAWLGDAVPPKKNIALFRIQEGDGGGKAANAYIVDVGLPTDLPLPSKAKRELTWV